MAKVRLDESAKAKMPDCGGNNLVNWTQQGPANVAGRCNTLAVKPNDENTVLAGFAGGGIFKSIDGGINWYPVFDDHLELCIADITFDPSNPNVVYAGTGDPNLPSIVFNGDGVYKSVNAGETWTYLGLSEVGIISKVVVDPTDPKKLLVAAMGNPYIRDEQRGIYKSTDGGLTWQKVLFVSNQAGASDLVQSPTNPNILYASFWDRIRSNTESILYGPNAKVFKSENGGDTWTQMTNGLPAGTMGRTGLAISQQNPDKAYVLYVDSLSTPGGLFKTVNGGASWTPVNISSLEDACADFGWYFGKIRMNPNNDEDLYFLAILLYRKPAGSNSWVSAGGGHADSHDLIFTPSGRRYWANDGGVYRNDVNQSSWTKCKNLPLTQFYHTDFNPHQPNVYWGGTQDNGIQKGVGGPLINNWTSVFSADGFNAAFDPVNPLVFWVEIQNGTIHKTNDGGLSWEFGTANLGTSDRCSWDAPFFMSSFAPNKLYAATYRVYASPGGGWGAISPDLTDGIIYSPRFHTVSALAESPAFAEKLMAGTSDGNVWRREPSSNWINITGSLPDRYVTSVQLSPTLKQRLFVTHSGFRNNEYIPHVHRSEDNGASWVDISGNLPQIPVNNLLVLPGHADSILFVATDAGVYFSKNSGIYWSRLGGNMPVIPVFDLITNPVRKELVAATFARGIWTFPLDSLFAQSSAPLVNISGAITTEAGEGVNSVQFGSTLTSQNGAYNIQNIPGCTALTLTPYRNDNPLNGLTTYDLVLISKHILGIEPLGSPYKMIAADANRSNNLTTLDIVTLRKLILGIDTELVGNTSWRFVPSNHNFSNPANPFQIAFPESIALQLSSSSLNNLNFKAIKVGDVNNTAVPNAMQTVTDRTVGSWPIGIKQQTFQANQALEVLVQGDIQELAALQFSLQFDTTFLQFSAVEPLLAGLSTDNFGINHCKNGVLSVSMEPEWPWSAEQTPLFKVHFTCKKTGDLRHTLQLGAWPTPALAFLSDGTALQPSCWNEHPGANFHFSPNPFGTEGVWVNIQMSADAPLPVADMLEILDLQGRILYSKQFSTAQRIFIGQENFPQQGIYFWRSKATGQSGKLVFVR
jgi:photosystem II stability/assembly factor-like uncharacterized protein